MEKSCCEFTRDDVEIKCYETEDGFRLVLKGDKNMIRAWKDSCCGSGEGKTSCC